MHFKGVVLVVLLLLCSTCNAIPTRHRRNQPGSPAASASNGVYHRTGYHFQPIKNWMNGVLGLIGAQLLIYILTFFWLIYVCLLLLLIECWAKSDGPIGKFPANVSLNRKWKNSDGNFLLLLFRTGT